MGRYAGERTAPRARSQAAAAPAGVDDDRYRRRPWAALAVLSGAAFMAQLDLFIVNVAMPTLSRSFPHDGLRSLSWVLSAYAIVFAALLVPAGRLADVVGRRRLLMVGVATFTVGSVLCAAAVALPQLLTGRVVQASGAALIVPTSLGLLLPSFDRRDHGLVVGIWAGVSAVAAAAGAPLGGLLVTVGWRWIFLINVPVGVVLISVARRTVREFRSDRPLGVPDVGSTGALLAAVALLNLLTVQGEQWGWRSARSLLVAAGVVLAAAVVAARVRSHPRPVIDRALLLSPPFRRATATLLLFFLGFAGWLLANVVFFQQVWHYSALRTGVALTPGPIFSALTAVNSGRLTRRFGVRPVACVGPLLFAAAAAWWLVAAKGRPDYLFGWLPGLVVAGVGSGMTQAPLFGSTSALPERFAATGAAVLTMARQVGSALGVAVIVAITAGRTGALGPYRAVWVFVAATTLAASLVQLAGGRPLRR